MTDIQFIQASKEFFLQYFVDELLDEKPSLMNMEELLDTYKQSIIQDYEITNKNRSGNAVPGSQSDNGPMPDSSADQAR